MGKGAVGPSNINKANNSLMASLCNRGDKSISLSRSTFHGLSFPHSVTGSFQKTVYSATDESI